MSGVQNVKAAVREDDATAASPRLRNDVHQYFLADDATTATSAAMQRKSQLCARNGCDTDLRNRDTGRDISQSRGFFERRCRQQSRRPSLR